MSQMKPYCFKCGAELDPEAIYCPECGRLQRSMVVRAVDPGAPSAPPVPQPEPPPEQPFQFYPHREEAAQGADAHPDQASHYPDSAWQQPDQPDPYPHQQYSDEGWERDEQHVQYETPPDQAYGHDAWAADPGAQQPAAGDHVYDQQAGPEPGPAERSWSASGYDDDSLHGQEAGSADHGYAVPVEPDTGYGEPEPPGRAEPWQRTAGPAYGHADPAPETPAAADPWHREPGEPAPAAPEPIYSSSAPVPPSGRAYQPYSAPSSRYRPAAANPYAAPYRPDAGDQRQGASPLRIVALVAAGLLGLFLIGFGIGHVMGVGSSPSGPPAAALPQQSTAPTTAPTSTPAPNPSSAPTPDQGGITGSAKFQRVSSSIPGRCTTSQGCPIEVTLKNSGGQGSGTVTVTLTDAPNGSPIATFTGPIPVTEAGATVQVTGYANGDQLPAYLRSGGTVYVNSVDVKSGG